MSDKPTPPASESIDEDNLMHFPCDFALKVMGENINNYPDYVLSVCQQHVECVTESCVHTRPSRSGKYIAVTVQLVATSRQQLDDLYIELNNHEQTKMAL
ncbi:MAG: DUF493 domain-containing protein [gamma proteobacterium symbiont of Bathyaustriella thionipta]|nr:DUF493 domain-containing protein [gamma proteobacterium symbiont of Bathyaustriella thionipta]MCU7948612.1 DUF493 domain-containing protein [gamma proteobacterium symbiont of Bathyaustriella thionipta]MCU7952883.1 DUF493 domain-containing protein [gamma proteobacterium symbiont of Bathyaustriella thionipta]MCU7955137.1 DUF493 domain-containing protein [gamma proteobacterium symbiont of Bathyaustriella thionipta]MCU7968875.1 DUF493 domain-containing protein [gamma proteobacterium symbiont of 